MVVRARSISSKSRSKGLSLGCSNLGRKAPIAASDEAAAQDGISGKWDNIIFNYSTCGAFYTSFRYGFIIDILSDFIADAEKFKVTLSKLDATGLNCAMGIMWDFINGHKLMYMESIIYEETEEKFKYLFDTASAVLIIQFSQVVERRAKELGVIIPADREYMVREKS